MKTLEIIAVGGTGFDCALVDEDSREYLGRMEYGSIDADGQYSPQDDDEIADAARAEYDIDESIPAVVR